MTEAHEKVLEEVQKGHSLKHVETTDKSKPAIDKDVHVKKVDRKGFLEEVKAEHQLHHTETVDKSKPAIDKDVHVKQIDRKGFLAEVEHGSEKLKSAKK
jgi:predicted GIY-YIG superfamily endonuclease